MTFLKRDEIASFVPGDRARREFDRMQRSVSDTADAISANVADTQKLNDAAFVTLSANAELPNEYVLKTGDGLSLTAGNGQVRLGLSSAAARTTGGFKVTFVAEGDSMVSVPLTGILATRAYVDAAVAGGGGGGGVTDGDKGDIVVSGGGTAWAIDAKAVTLAKQADMASGSVVYRKTAGAGPPEVQSLATLKTDLGLTGTNSGDQDLSGYAPLASPTFTGTVSGITKAMVELGSVDNTADAAKAVLSATKLVTARTIAMSGDVTWSVSFDGSGNVTAGGTLATVNSNTGTFGGATTSPQISVNGKGLITGVSAVAISIPFSQLTSVPTTLAGHNITLTSGNVTAALGYTPVNPSSLGTASSQNTGTSGGNVPLLNGANTWSARQTGSEFLVTGAAGAFILESRTGSGGTWTNYNNGGIYSLYHSTGGNLFTVDATGNITTLGSLAMGGAINSTFAITAPTFQVSGASGALNIATRDTGASWTVYNSGGTLRFYSGSDLLTLTTGGVLTAGGFASTGGITSSSATAGIGYSTGAGGAVTQATSRTTGVTLNKVCGAITLFSKTTTASLVETFTVTNSAVAATDVIEVCVKSGTGVYLVFVTGVSAGSFKVSVFTPAAVGSAEAPVISFCVNKAVAA